MNNNNKKKGSSDFVHGHFTSKVKRFILKRFSKVLRHRGTMTTLTCLFLRILSYILPSLIRELLHLALSPQGHEHSAWDIVDA